LRGGSHGTTRAVSDGGGERAVRLVLEHQAEYPSPWAAITSIATKWGMTPEALRKWVRRAEVDAGARPGLTMDERQRLRDLERENRELTRSAENLPCRSIQLIADFGIEYRTDLVEVTGCLRNWQDQGHGPASQRSDHELHRVHRLQALDTTCRTD
jgi:transposase